MTIAEAIKRIKPKTIESCVKSRENDFNLQRVEQDTQYITIVGDAVVQIGTRNHYHSARYKSSRLQVISKYKGLSVSLQDAQLDSIRGPESIIVPTAQIRNGDTDDDSEFFQTQRNTISAQFASINGHARVHTTSIGDYYHVHNHYHPGDMPVSQPWRYVSEITLSPLQAWFSTEFEAKDRYKLTQHCIPLEISRDHQSQIMLTLVITPDGDLWHF